MNILPCLCIGSSRVTSIGNESSLKLFIKSAVRYRYGCSLINASEPVHEYRGSVLFHVHFFLFNEANVYIRVYETSYSIHIRKIIYIILDFLINLIDYTRYPIT